MLPVSCPVCGRSYEAESGATCPHCEPQSAQPATATLPPPAFAGADTVSFSPHTTPTAPNRGPTAPAIPGFDILGELGRGGMGVVYEARQHQPRRLVALKMILAAEHAGTEQLARFRTEAEAAARLQHPSIVQVHEVGEHGGRPFLTMEYIAGGNLARLMKRDAVPPARAAELVRQLARAVQHAHEQGVVHRDLKPGNILLQPQDQGGAGDLPWLPKIADFGLAKQLEGLASVAAGPVTASGAILGTPQYMAPEQVRGKSGTVGPAADVYALGAILYELLSGRPPFEGDNTLDLLMRVATEEPASLRQLKPGVPRDLETICLKCLEKDPARRYASAGELAEDLRCYLAGAPIRARAQSLPERVVRWTRRHKEMTYLFSGVAAALLLTALVLAVWNPFRGTPTAQTNSPYGGGSPFADSPKKMSPPTMSPALPPDLNLIPRDVLGFVTIRVGDLWTLQDPLAPATAKIWADEREQDAAREALAKLEQELALKPQDIERLTVVVPNLAALHGLNHQTEAGPIVLFAFNKPYDWDKVKHVAALNQPYENKVRGKWIIYEPANDRGPPGPALFPQSDTVLVLGRGEDIARLLDQDKEKAVNAAGHEPNRSRLSAAAAAKQPEKVGPLFEALKLAAGKHHYVMGVCPPRQQLELLQKFAKDAFPPALLDVQTATLRLDLLPPVAPGHLVAGLDAELRLVFPDAAKAKNGELAATDLVQNALKWYDNSDLAKQVSPLLNSLLEPLRQPAWKRDGQNVTLATQIEWKAPKIEIAMADWVGKLKDSMTVTKSLAIQPANSVNRLKQLALGMHSYYDANKRLPAAAITDKQGKPLLSWRVAILPYIDQQDLYQQFALDRPWDDPVNLKLLDKMPDVFKAPRPKDWKAKPEDKTHTPYQVLVGPNTIFDPMKKLTLGQIAASDGTATTILIVEGAKHVPWTKPEDISFDKQPLWPRLGGLSPGGFHAAMCDGSVLFFPKTYTEQQLRDLTTFNDGVVVPLP